MCLMGKKQEELDAPVVPSEFGVSTLERGVSVGLRLLDAVPVG